MDTSPGVSGKDLIYGRGQATPVANAAADSGLWSEGVFSRICGLLVVSVVWIEFKSLTQTDIVLANGSGELDGDSGPGKDGRLAQRS